MTIRDLYKKLSVVPRGAASAAIIIANQQRLGGTLPETLVSWFLEANAFEGRSEVCLWHFDPIEEIQTIDAVFPECKHINLTLASHTPSSTRICKPNDYAIFCDQMFNLPFYAVNIRNGSNYYGEVIFAIERTPGDATLSTATFDEFAGLLFRDYEEGWIVPW